MPSLARTPFLSVLAVLVLSAPLQAQEGSEQEPARKPIVIATVNDAKITDLDVEEHLRKSYGDDSWKQLPKAKLAEVLKDVREQHIRVLVIEAELARRGVTVTRAEKRAKVAELRRELMKQNKRLDDVLRAANSNLWFLERAMGGTVGLFKIVSAKVDDDQVKQYFNSHPRQFQPRWKVRQILQLTVDRKTRAPLPQDQAAKAKARIIEAAKALRDGASFDDCVAKYSNGPRARLGGSLPWYGVTNKLPDSFKRAMKSLTKVGQTSKIIRTAYGWHILMLEAKYEPRWQDARQPCVQAIQESLMKEVLAQAKVKRYSFVTGKELPPPGQKQGTGAGSAKGLPQIPKKK